MRLLVIEDHADIAANIGDFLALRGWEVDFADTGPRGLALAQSLKFDALVLDLNLPGMDGLAVAQQLRQDEGAASQHAGILMLTARDTLDDKLQGFAAGSDDYLVKPFALRELEARLLALLKRSAAAADQGQVLKLANLSLDLRTLEIRRGSREIILKPKARQLLEVLLKARGAVLSRSEIEDALWGDLPPDGEALRVHVHELRHAVDGAGEPPLVHTVRGAGYRMCEK